MSSSSERLAPPTAETTPSNGNIRRSASRETLSAHPLLSSSPTPSSVSVDSTTKYLPYTPRQRAPIGSVTTGAVHSSVSVSPQHQQSIATSKLQLQNLKAAAQGIGLDSGSIGWLMLETLVAGPDHGTLMTELWNAVTVGKATFLLPLEKAASHEPVSAEFIQDHIVFASGGALDNTSMVTLSGIRGSLQNHQLTVRSVLAPASKAFNSLRSPTTRSSTLASLPALPKTEALSELYPKYEVTSFSETLPLPPRANYPQKPPLPPRPGSRPSSSQSPASRLSNPFASLFSKSPPSAPQPAPALPEPVPVDHIVNVSAFSIDKPIVAKEVARSLNKAIKADLKTYLHGQPTWVVDRVQAFASKLLPFPKQSKRSKDTDIPAIPNSPFIHSSVIEPVEDLEQAFQSFYGTLEEELRTESTSSVLRKRDDRHTDSETEKPDHTARIQATMEAVERALCSVFYDRLFRQSSSDDSSHDEALSSRIAALNMLDLDLSHLGVDVGAIGADIDRIVEACGQTISQVEVAQCPAEKAAIIVAAHKVVVDGLSKLPPVKLKGEGGVDNDTPKPISSEKLESVEIGAPEPLKTNGLPLAAETELDSKHLGTVKQPADPNSEPADTTDSVPAVVDVLSASPDSEPTLLTISPASTPTPVSGDVLLPLIIFSVVKANPPQLVSHLLYTQRYRNRNVGGEENYCLINLLAVCEFLENVDLKALGLESDSKVISTADLTPIPIPNPEKSNAHTPHSIGTPLPSLRGRVEQQVDAIAGSANKVISGVVDSFGVLRAFLPANAEQAAVSEDPVPSNRPGFGLLRRESGFSIASLAASLPGGSSRDRRHSVAVPDEDGQELVESRPGSVRSVFLDEEDSSSEEDNAVRASDDDEDDEAEEEDAEMHDTRSIRSFESMMGRNRRKHERKGTGRLSLTDRLASMSKLTRPHTRETSHVSNPGVPVLNVPLSAPVTSNRFDTPMSSRASSPSPIIPVLIEPKRQIAPPNRRFMECSVDDLKVSEIRELLVDYRRLAEAVRSMGGFDEPPLEIP